MQVSPFHFTLTLNNYGFCVLFPSSSLHSFHSNVNLFTLHFEGMTTLEFQVCIVWVKVKIKSSTVETVERKHVQHLGQSVITHLIMGSSYFTHHRTKLLSSVHSEHLTRSYSYGFIFKNSSMYFLGGSNKILNDFCGRLVRLMFLESMPLMRHP